MTETETHRATGKPKDLGNGWVRVTCTCGVDITGRLKSADPRSPEERLASRHRIELNKPEWSR